MPWYHRAASLPAMETIGTYEIVRRMGTDALGEIYECRGPSALRCILRTCALDDARSREQFAAAALRLRELRHPAIAAVLDSGVEQGVPYMVEEFLAGEMLDRRLERGAPMALQDSMAVLFQVAQALAAASARGVAHRDLRPAHVRLLGDGRIKVHGFGTAQLAHTATGGHLPTSGDAPSEIAYMSPEQIRGDVGIDDRSDQFSFGVMAYELLSSRRPFGGERAADLMIQILSAEPIALSERSLDCPPAMARIVSRCLEKEAARRFPNAQELAGAMAPLVDVVMDGPRQVTRVMDPAELSEAPPPPEARRSEARARIAQHLVRGELGQAEASLREAERLWGGVAGYADLRHRLNELRDVERRAQVKSLLESARRFLAEGDPDLAQRACVEALTLDPAEPEAHRVLAETRKQLDQQRHEDEMETSRSIARAAVAELLASPDLLRRDGPPPTAAGLASRAADDGEATAAGLEATVAGLVPPPPPPELSTSWPPFPPSQQSPILAAAEAVPSVGWAPAAAAPLPQPPASGVPGLVARIERLIAAGALEEARPVLDELKAAIQGDDAVRQQHSRLAATLVDALQAQQRLRPFGAAVSVEAPGSRARVTAAAPRPSTGEIAAPISKPAPPTVAPPAPVAAPAAKPAAPSARKGWVVIAIVGGLGLLALAGLGGLWWWSNQRPAPPPPAAPAPPKPARLVLPPNPLVGLTVQIDGAAPLPLATGQTRELPAGEHVLTFVAPGNQPLEVRLQLAAGELRTQSTPILTPEAPASAAEPEPAAAPTPRKRKPAPAPEVAPPPVAPPAPAPEPPPAPRATQRGDLVEAGPGVVPPKTLSIPGARYPERAKREQREATIGVLVLVDENGKPSAVKIQDGDPNGVGFDDAALDAARRATFQPATKDGVPVKMWKLVRVGFRLK